MTSRNHILLGIGIVVCAALLALAYVLVPTKGDIYERFEVRQNGWKIRYTARYEEYFFLPGAYLSFESTHPESEEWKVFLDFRVDDPIDLPRERIVLLNDSVAYVNLWDKAAITTDAGRTWNIWRPIYPLSDGTLLIWSIEKMEIRMNGSGIATLNAYDSNLDQRISKTIVTQDFAHTWAEMER